jgi:hypothetical protein
VRAVLIGAVVLAGLIGLFVWAFNPSVEPVRVGGDDVASEVSKGPTATTERRSVLDESRRRAADVAVDAGLASEPESAPTEDPPAPERPPESPLTGLSVGSVSSSDLRQQGVPDKWDGGVVVTRIEPDSPADEVALEVGDIIVELRRSPVRQPTDLEEIMADHGYAKVTFVRDGQVLQVVLQRPYRP